MTIGHPTNGKLTFTFLQCIIHSYLSLFTPCRLKDIPVNPRYDDDIINHSVEYVNARGATTNHAERYWREIKMRFKAMNGVKRSTMKYHLFGEQTFFNNYSLGQ